MSDEPQYYDAGSCRKQESAPDTIRSPSLPLTRRRLEDDSRNTMEWRVGDKAIAVFDWRTATSIARDKVESSDYVPQDWKHRP